jgi:hypothetical protein
MEGMVMCRGKRVRLRLRRRETDRVCSGGYIISSDLGVRVRVGVK